MAISTQPKCDVYGTLTISDGTTPTALSLELGYDNGDFAVSGLADVLNEVTPVQRRGRHVGVIHGARTYPQLSFTGILMSLQHASAPGSFEEFLAGLNAYSARVGKGPTGSPTLLDLEWKVEGTTFGDENDISVIFRDVYWTWDLSEGQPSTFSYTGTVYGAVEGDLAAAGVTVAPA